jgi:hypothetical protein
LNPAQISNPASVRPRQEALPSFAENRRPTPETPARKRLIHGAALATLLLSFAYLAWRLTSTIDLGVWWAHGQTCHRTGADRH